MGKPIQCPECKTLNGLLAEECRMCGEVISLSGKTSRAIINGGWVPSAIWKTQCIPDLWRKTQKNMLPHYKSIETKQINLHDVLRYAHLLNAIRNEFDKDDKKIWFDDCLFFLRGGYDFFCNLNLNSNLQLRGTIFGGLNHAKRPKQALDQWVVDIMNEAKKRSHRRIDVFVADEVNSGAGTRQIVKAIQSTVVKWISINQSRDSSPKEFHLWMYLSRDIVQDQTFKKFLHTVTKQDKFNSVFKFTFELHIKLFRGPMIAYDSDELSGIKVCSTGNSNIEKYEIIKSRAFMTMSCPNSNGLKDFYLPSGGDLSTDLGIFLLELTKPSMQSPMVKILSEAILNTLCKDCRSLLEDLQKGGSVYRACFLKP